MFAIYTPNGRTFSGTLEELKSVEKPDRLKSARKHQHLDDLQNIAQKEYHLSPNAVAAYKEVINKQNEISPILHAYQIMSSPLQILRSEDKLSVAIEKFKKFSYQDFPILNNHNQLIGNLSRQNIYEYILKNKTFYHESDKDKTLAELFINKDSKIYSAEPITDIRRIARLLIENGLHTVPIIENAGRIVGIVSRTDIIKATIKEPPLSLWC